MHNHVYATRHGRIDARWADCAGAYRGGSAFFGQISLQGLGSHRGYLLESMADRSLYINSPGGLVVPIRISFLNHHHLTLQLAYRPRSSNQLCLSNSVGFSPRRLAPSRYVSSSSYNNVALTLNYQPMPPSLSSSSLEAPVIYPYPQGSSPTSSCSTLVGTPAIGRKDLTIVKCLSIKHARDVWLVSHKHTGQHYTLHIYQLHLMSDEQRDLVRNEREMMILLSASGYFLNIVSHWSDMGETCILTDYHSSTVQDNLTEQPLSKREAQRYAAHMVCFRSASSYTPGG